MPLSPEERERIREIESLKAEIRKEVQPDKPESKISKFFRHQAVLLVLGFGFTTVVGGALTSWWKSKEWKNQQSYLAQQRSLDKKYALMDETFKEVAATTTAAEDVLNLYYGPNWTKADTRERSNQWYQSSRQWRVAAKRLDQSLRTGFNDQNIQKTFEQLVMTRKFLGNDIGRLLHLEPAKKSKTVARGKKRKPGEAGRPAYICECKASVQKPKQQGDELAERLCKDNCMVQEVIDLLTQCGTLMKTEIQISSVNQ